MELTAVVLAAGLGKRMKSTLPKVMHPVAGKPMVGYVVDSACNAGADRVVMVVGIGAEQVQHYFADRVEYALQAEQLGTAHALLQAEPVLAGSAGSVLVINGDTPLITPDVLRDFAHAHAASGAVATILTAEIADPTGYGRIIRGADGTVARMAEEKDATAAERAVREVNTGIYCFQASGITDTDGRSYSLWDVLRRIGNSNAQNEFYLTEVATVLTGMGHRLHAFAASSVEWVLAPNNRRQLAEAEAIYRRRILNHWMDEGVSILDPNTTYIDAEVSIGTDTTIWPGTFIQGRTTIGSGCVIGPNSRVVHCHIGDHVQLDMSVVEHSTIGDHCHVGPYAHLRAGCVLGRHVELGNYAEAKKTHFEDGVKCHHHSYLGDAHIGANANIGAGTITANYDGFVKHRTEIGARSFVGVNANLLAPLQIGADAYIAAGSTVNHDVPDQALAIGRPRQENKEGYAKLLREKASRRAQRGTT